MIMKKVIITALACLALAACLGTEVTVPSEPTGAAIEDRSKLEVLVDKATTLAPFVADLVIALGFDPIDMTHEEAEALQAECLKWADLGAEASDREKRVCALATEIVNRPPIDPGAERSG